MHGSAVPERVRSDAAKRRGHGVLLSQDSRQPGTVVGVNAPMTRRFVGALERYAQREGVDPIRFGRGERKDARTQAYLRHWHGGEGVLYIGKAQERARVVRTERRHGCQTPRGFPRSRIAERARALGGLAGRLRGNPGMSRTTATASFGLPASTAPIFQRYRHCGGGRPDAACVAGSMDKDFAPTTANMAVQFPELDRHQAVEWAQVEAAVTQVVGDIQVRMINGTAKDALDYTDHEEVALKVIAIGGDKLARGLTLEGLTTSYFLRASKMYDTLMQMGRWFGYRPGYIDLCRLYTTDDLVEWFEHIGIASEELREEFDYMAASGATPREYGLKVQSHPVLMVTSRLKMRTARRLALSFSGNLLETVHVPSGAPHSREEPRSCPAAPCRAWRTSVGPDASARQRNCLGRKPSVGRCGCRRRCRLLGSVQEPPGSPQGQQ